VVREVLEEPARVGWGGGVGEDEWTGGGRVRSLSVSALPLLDVVRTGRHERELLDDISGPRAEELTRGFTTKLLTAFL
jgi:hypothetical protein